MPLGGCRLSFLRVEPGHPTQHVALPQPYETVLRDGPPFCTVPARTSVTAFAFTDQFERLRRMQSGPSYPPLRRVVQRPRYHRRRAKADGPAFPSGPPALLVTWHSEKSLTDR